MPQKITHYGLAYYCPHLDRNEVCPLKLIEHLSFLEKVKWIDSLSDEEKETILERHQICTKNRFSIVLLVAPLPAMARGFLFLHIQILPKHPLLIFLLIKNHC